MAYPVADDLCIEIAMYCATSDQAGINTLRFRTTDSAGTVSLQDVADWWSTMAATYYKPMISSDASYLGCSVRNLTTLPLEIAWWAQNGAGVGTMGDLLPAQLAALVSMRTLRAGPSGRGRHYIPFPGVGAIGANGVLDGDYAADVELWRIWATADHTFTDGGDTVTLTPGLWALPTSLLTFLPFVDSSVATGFATQRRRGYFGRKNALPSPLQ